TIPLIQTTRGNLVEAVHRGALAVVDSAGRLVAQAGDPNWVVSMRSSAKPFQLLPLVESGLADQLGFGEHELAVMAASHNGGDMHVEAVGSILERLGLDEGALLCGTHPPIDRQAAAALVRAAKQPSPLQHNCSGKHAGILACIVGQGLSVENYTDPTHPVQTIILQTLSEMSDCPSEQIQIGIDGCSVPVLGLPLRQAALAFARLADPSALPEPRQSACRRIVAAMMAHPEMVAGSGRFDTALMRAGGGNVVSKGGAQGYQGLGVLPGGAPAGRGLGLALKIEDGNGRRGTPPATLETLRQLGILDKLPAEAQAELADWGPRPLYNYRQIRVGELGTIFSLESAP
ncbi:MAG: asparaginase, partial [Delftia sp.]|nr:asparaginase [Delftia sp.]